MQKLIGMSRKVLEVDLTAQSFKIFTVPEEDIFRYLGGKGLGLKLIYDRIKPGIDSLGEENIIAFMTGALLGTGASCTSRFSAVTKTPLTGIMAASSCGGPFGEELKTAGWDGILITGKSKNPVYLVVSSDGVEFVDAANLWGKDAMATQEILGKKEGMIVIGQAGENLVRVANIVSGHRYLGRAGMGAVMGSKNLKSILAVGKAYKIVPKEKEEFDKLKKRALKYINASTFTGDGYRNYGTASHLNYCNKQGTLSVNNFTKGMHKDAYKISGEEMKAKHDTKHHTCRSCTILCGKKGTFDGKKRVTPEYETVSLLGANIGVFDPVRISEWNELCGKYGMDTISVGNIIAWVMEATEKGLVKSDLKFGSPSGVDQIITDMALSNGLGEDMALGVKALAEKYGGKEFAIQVKGLEVSAYDPRGAFGQGLAYAVANRGGCHLSAGLFFMENIVGLLNPQTVRAKADFVKFFEDLFNGINSISICLFTSTSFPLEVPLIKYAPNLIVHFLMQYCPKIAIQLVDISFYPKLWSSITGLNLSSAEFLRAGERTHILERYMNTREGICRKDDT
ncbi:MAG: aldehyde ferredoxin oxidoreductase, partial [Desulfobacterales bacterium]|nr:aldehyde ferredoxin oxidoreductase [Desulfobacterales bacterium]